LGEVNSVKFTRTSHASALCDDGQQDALLGHDGIWNIIRELTPPEERREILDWYHLKENL
jgi:hypothetical protein